MSDKYKTVFAAVRRDKKIAIICADAGIAKMTFHNVRFRRDMVGEDAARRVYATLEAHRYLPSWATFETMFPRHTGDTSGGAKKAAERAIYEHSLAALWLKWKTSPLIVRDLYENGSPKIREQAKVYLQNVPLAPRGTAGQIEMRNFAREWVEASGVRA